MKPFLVEQRKEYVPPAYEVMGPLSDETALAMCKWTRGSLYWDSAPQGWFLDTSGGLVSEGDYILMSGAQIVYILSTEEYEADWKPRDR